MNLRSVVVTARRFIAIDGYDRALALAAKAFVAVIPLEMVLARSHCGRLGCRRAAARQDQPRCNAVIMASTAISGLTF